MEPYPEPWQQRVIKEREELQKKITKLRAFLDREDNYVEAHSILLDQLAAMELYRSALVRRIHRF